MYYEKDYILRLVEDLSSFIATILFGKKQSKYEIVNRTNLSKTDKLYEALLLLVSENKICEAEDLLFETIEAYNIDYVRIALDFYQVINNLTDEELESYNYSRGEIIDGLKQITTIFGINIEGIF